MKYKILLGPILVLALGLGGCTKTLEDIGQSTSTGTVQQQIGTGQVEQAYTALEVGLHLYLTTATNITPQMATTIDTYNVAVHDALVKIRDAAQKGQSPAMAAETVVFNAALAKLKGYVNQNGGHL